MGRIRPTYDPLGILKPVDEDIWIVDGPLIRFHGLPFPTRMTVVRLGDGSLWLHSPTALDPSLQAALQAEGPIRHLVAPNWIHYAHVADWKSCLPDALAWASPGVRERAASRGVAVTFDRDLGPVAPAEWAAQIDQRTVGGSRVHREVVFFHRPSATLILTDLIENFEPARLPWWMRPLTRLAGIAAPHGGMPRDMAATFRKGRGELRAAVEWMLERRPRRVIIAHGEWFDTGGEAVLRRAFDWVLKQG